MKGVILSEKEKAANKSGFLLTLKYYVLVPLQNGIAGFALFFLILLLSKYVATLLGSAEEFVVGIEDVILSLLGFGLFFLIKFLDNFKEK